MIDYPSDRETLGEAKTQGLPPEVLVRDIVRLVEVLNLKQQGFFSKRSVLAGSMGLRSYGSPRFTVYDADFSTSSEVVDPPTAMKEKLTYRDDELEIVPSELEAHDGGGTMWTSAPVRFEPIFTSLVPNPGDRRFKADVSFRGLVLEGVERPLATPYTLRLWHEAPVVYVMDPHETVAEKILGWCVHRLVKHYADLAYIAIVSHRRAELRLIELDYRIVREVLAAKLATMRRLQPSLYAPFPHIEALVGELSKPPQLDRTQWARIMYVRSERDRYRQDVITDAVTNILARGLRLAAPR